jgi:ATP-dependent Lon protease
MTGAADDRIMWLATVICMPTRRAATRAAFNKIIAIGRFRAVDMPKLPCTDHFPRGFAEWARRHDHHVLALAFDLVALSTDDSAATAHIVASAIGLLCSADGDTSEARARLRVWDDVARGKHTGDDFFEIADEHWMDEMRFIVATGRGVTPMRDRFSHPALQLLMHSRWDEAFAYMYDASGEYLGERAQPMLDARHDRAAIQVEIRDLIEYLYSVGTPRAGARALAWQMLTADPTKLQSFHFLPQLQFAIDHAELEAEDDADVRARIRIWWRAAEGEWTDSEVSIFWIADAETRTDAVLPDPDVEPQDMRHDLATDTPSWLAAVRAPPADPTLVVMPQAKASKLNNFHSQYKDLVDAALPLVVVRDVAGIRAALHAEFPHAVTAVDLLLRDLREAKPVWLKPMLLVGSPGCGKSRLVRRLADIAGRLYVYRFDAASSSDSHFGGTSKAWSNTEPSVPARAVAQSKTANPIVLVDEIDKAAARNWNGRLWDSLLPFLDLETAGRYRDQSLDCELDLSMVSYVSTANDVTGLPAPLRDRFRVIKVPAPTLAHLPQLAAEVMKDLAIEDESRQHDAPLAADELAVMAKAWAQAKFSMRALQKIVSATLDARDSYAMRH